MPDVASGSAEHRGCEWEKVGSCVYCKDHGTRLYHGELPNDSAALADALADIQRAALAWLENALNDGDGDSNG